MKSRHSSCARRWASCRDQAGTQRTGSAHAAACAIGMRMDTGEQRDVAQHVGGQCVMNGHELRVGPARRTGAEPIRHLFKQTGKEADALGRGCGWGGNFTHTPG